MLGIEPMRINATATYPGRHSRSAMAIAGVIGSSATLRWLCIARWLVGRRALWTIGCAISLVGGISAQPATVEVARNAASAIVEPDANQTASDPTQQQFGPNLDLGRQVILEPRPRPRLFQIYSDTQLLYDSNILLTDGDFIEQGETTTF